MLASLAACMPYLCCPGGGADLHPVNETTLSCKEGDHNKQYSIVNGVPIIVDFESSVLNEAETKQSSARSRVTRRDYDPVLGWVRRLVSPRKASTAQNVLELIRRLRATGPVTRLLVVGGGTVGQGMEDIYAASDIEIVGFDIYASPMVQFVADAHRIPLKGSLFDAVIIQAVLEHVLEPQVVVSEIWRVLKPGGLVYAETPFMQQVHEGPYDFTRFTESGHRYLFRRFEVIASGPSGGPGLQFLWSVDYLARGIFRSRMAGQIAKLLVFWIQYADKIIPLDYAIDAASGFYFLGAKSEKIVGPDEIISFYKGSQS